MKKLFPILILLMSVLCFSAGAEEKPSTISIGLFYGWTVPETMQISSGDGLIIGETEVGTDITLKIDANCVVVLSDDGTELLRGGENQQINISSPGKVMRIGDKKYRGETVVSSDNGKLKIISIADIDDYISGVIPREVYASWPAETLKAQAIASRTLVYKSFRGKHKDLGFDVCTTTNCQVYGGYDSETPQTTAAVYATEDLVAVYDGEPADTLFGASNGGWKEDSSNVWGGKYPYLVTARDEYEKTDEIPGHVWTVEMTAEEVAADLSKAGYDVGNVKKLEIAEKSQSGRVTVLKVYGENGECEIKKDAARGVFGLKSQLYTVSSPSSSADVFVVTSSGVSKAGDNLNVLSTEGGNTVSGTVSVLSASGQTSVSLETAVSDKFVFSGRGYGHGVGMSQWGAKYMADAGFSCDEIIKYYYPGVEIVKY